MLFNSANPIGLDGLWMSVKGCMKSSVVLWKVSTYIFQAFSGTGGLDLACRLLSSFFCLYLNSKIVFVYLFIVVTEEAMQQAKETHAKLSIWEKKKGGGKWQDTVIHMPTPRLNSPQISYTVQEFTLISNNLSFKTFLHHVRTYCWTCFAIKLTVISHSCLYLSLLLKFGMNELTQTFLRGNSAEGRGQSAPHVHGTNEKVEMPLGFISDIFFFFLSFS